MKPVLCMLLMFLLYGCQINPYTYAPHWTGTDWYGEGLDDGRSGITARSDEQLANDLDDPKVDHSTYMKGYNLGLADICTTHLLFGWGVSGKIYPQGCDTRDNASELRQAWRDGINEGAKSNRLN